MISYCFYYWPWEGTYLEIVLLFSHNHLFLQNFTVIAEIFDLSVLFVLLADIFRLIAETNSYIVYFFIWVLFYSFKLSFYWKFFILAKFICKIADRYYKYLKLIFKESLFSWFEILLKFDVGCRHCIGILLFVSYL